MSDEYHYPNSVASLPVLPKTGKDAESEQSMNHPTAAADGHMPPQRQSTAGPPAPAPEPGPVPESAGAPDPTRFIHQKLIEGKVIEAVQKVYDPEIPVNIYELGLIYDIAVNTDDSVHIKMTLTAPACPVAGSLPGEVERQIETIPEVKSATVELVWDPPWSRDRMSEAAQLQLGLI